MSKKRDRKSKVSDEAIVHSWRQIMEIEDGWDEFDCVIRRCLEENGLGRVRVEAILNKLEGSEIGAFLADVERIVTEPVSAMTLSARRAQVPCLATARLLGVPISGSRVAIEAFCESENLHLAAKAIRASGYSQEVASIILLPVPVSSLDLQFFSPEDLDDLACVSMDVGLGLIPADEKVPEQMLRRILQSANPSGRGAAPAEGRVDLVNWVLIAAQVVLRSEGEDDEVDVLSLLGGEASGQGNEADQDQVVAATNEWHRLVSAIRCEDFVIHPPVRWNDVRHTLMTNHVDMAISTALAMNGKEGDPSEVEIEIAHNGSELVIFAHHGADFLTKVEVPYELMIDGVEEFMSDLLDDYSARQASSPDTPFAGLPVFH